MKKRNIIILWIYILFFISHIYSKNNTGILSNKEKYIEQMKGEADKLKLSSHHYWHLLLHYRSRIWGGVQSENDSDNFFLSKEGKINSKLELMKTIESFFHETSRQEKINVKYQHPICRFPARFKWLDEQLHFKKKYLQSPKCISFQKWKNKLNPKSISIVFASFYINNPASMFGHTLLKLNRSDDIDKTSILDYAVNFAANTGVVNPLVYIAKGIWGGFQGRFFMFPYYFKIREYNDNESRDLWEYKLNLTEREIDILMMHLWELSQSYFDYYYFDENCSYQLIALLEVVRPTIQLSNQFRLFVHPIDTIKILKKNRFISKIKFRPSSLTSFKGQYESLSSKEKDLFWDIVNNYKEENFNVKNSSLIFVLDTVFLYYNFMRAHRQKLDRKVEKHFNDLLNIRSTLYNVKKHKVKEKGKNIYLSDPTLSHESSQWLFTIGKNNIAYYHTLTFLPSLRTMIDSPLGYLANTEILFLSPTIRYSYQEKNSVSLDDFRLLGISSFFPIREYLKKISWSINWGVKSNLNELESNLILLQKQNYIHYLGGGLGGATNIYKINSQNSLLLFIMLENYMEISPNYFPSYIRIRSNFFLGCILRFTKYFSFMYKVSYDYLFFNLEELSNKKLLLDTQFMLHIHSSYSIQIKLQYEYFEKRNDIHFGIKYYI